MTAEELIQIAENEPMVYEAGKAEGIEQGVEQGIEQGLAEVSHLNDELEQILYGTDTGGKSFYDEFWDDYQGNGSRVDYDLAFGGKGWTIDTFKPKYDIIPSTAYMLFRKSEIAVDIVEYLNELGVKLDFSNCTGLLYAFSLCPVTRVGEIDGRASGASITFDSVFYYADKLHTIDKLYLSETKPNFNNITFGYCTRLVNLTLEGTIRNNGLNLQWSKNLSKASIENIIGCLSSSTSGLTITLSKTAVNNAFTTDEWNTLIATKKNWTISLV